jgi:hypothetical protein
MTWTYDVRNPSAASGSDDGSMIITGGGSVLSQSLVNNAIDSYNNYSGNSVPLRSVIITGGFYNVSAKAFNATLFTSIVFPTDSQVTSFGTQVFYYCRELVNLVLPPQLSTVSNGMCQQCLKLKSVVIPESVTSFQGMSFSGCTELEYMVVPKSVVAMAYQEFSSCPNLVHIEILNFNISSISSNMFQSSTNIRFMKVSNTLWSTYIQPNNPQLRPILQLNGQSSFQTYTGSSYIQGNAMALNSDGSLSGSYNGTLLINQTGSLARSVIDGYLAKSTRFLGLVVTLSAGVTTLDTDVFSGLTGLTEVKFNTNNVVTALKDRSFQGCSRLKSLILPTGVTTIGPQTFQGCSSLTQIIVPSGVTIIENETFQGATSLVSAELLGTITAVGDKAFQGCTLLEKIAFSEGLTSLGTAICENCTSLRNVAFPQSLLTITGTGILAGATAVRTLKVQESLYDKMSLVENKDHVQLVQFYGESKILQPLKTQLDYWTGLQDGSGLADAKAYQKVIDYYSTSGSTYTTDWSNGTSPPTFVNYSAFGDVTYDVSTGTLSGLGTYDGALTIVGTGELTRNMVDAAIGAHGGSQNGIVPLRTLTVGPTFTSLETTLSLQGTGLKSLVFPAESPITTTGDFELAIDSTLAQTVVLPRWVVNQGPWSLI